MCIVLSAACAWIHSLHPASLPALNDLDAAAGPPRPTPVPRHAHTSLPPPHRPRPNCWYCCWRDLPATLTMEARCSASTNRVLGLDVLVPGGTNGGAWSTLVHPGRLATHLNMSCRACLRKSECLTVGGFPGGRTAGSNLRTDQNASGTSHVYCCEFSCTFTQHVGARSAPRRGLYCWRARHK